MPSWLYDEALQTAVKLGHYKQEAGHSVLKVFCFVN